MDFKPRTIYRIECVTDLDVTAYVKEFTDTYVGLGVCYDGKDCYQYMVIPWSAILCTHRENDISRIKRIQQYIGELKGFHEDDND
jgi:hypothetical protein